MKTALQFLFVWVLVLSTILAFQFKAIYSGRSAARSDNRATWHMVVCKLEEGVLRNPNASAKQKTESVKFWTDILVNLVHTTPCD